VFWLFSFVFLCFFFSVYADHVLSSVSRPLMRGHRSSAPTFCLSSKTDSLQPSCPVNSVVSFVVQGCSWPFQSKHFDLQALWIDVPWTPAFFPNLSTHLLEFTLIPSPHSGVLTFDHVPISFFFVIFFKSSPFPCFFDTRSPTLPRTLVRSRLPPFWVLDSLSTRNAMPRSRFDMLGSPLFAVFSVIGCFHPSLL